MDDVLQGHKASTNRSAGRQEQERSVLRGWTGRRRVGTEYRAEQKWTAGKSTLGVKQQGRQERSRGQCHAADLGLYFQGDKRPIAD